MIQSRLLKISGWAGALALAVAVYFPSFNAPFQFDDFFVIITNPTVARLNDLGAIWNWDPSRFLTYLTFAVNYYLDGVNPFGYHLVNFFLHLGATAFVYYLAKLILEGQWKNRSRKKNRNENRIALFTALVFLLHPIQTSAVTYIAQRSTLLATLFYLGAVTFYILFRQKENSFAYLLAIIFTVLGIFSKPIIITLPLALALYEGAWGESKPKGHRFGTIAPFVLLVGFVPILLTLLQSQPFDFARLLNVTRETTAFTRTEYLFTQFHVIWTYVRLLFVPLGQNIDYDYAIVRSLDLPTLICGLGLLGLILVALWLWKKDRLMSFGIFWFFITLSLESSIFPISDVIFEHRLYLPFFGLALTAGALVARGIKNVYLYRIILIAIVAALSILTFQRNQVWSDRIDFLRDTVSKSPHKARVYNSLAVAYAEAGQYGPALAALERAIKLDPTNIDGYNNRANIYRITGQHDLAIREYDFILAHATGYTMAYYFRSQSWAAKGEKQKALSDAIKAKELGFPVGEEYLKALGRSEK